MSHKPPRARSNEPDWYECMKRRLDELAVLRNKTGAVILCAGDVFDRWDSPPELINFAIDHLPRMYMIAGQHDLPNHQIEDVKRSAYGVLTNDTQQKFGDLWSTCGGTRIRNLLVHGVPWGQTPQQVIGDNVPDEYGIGNKVISICCWHKYVWTSPKNAYGACSDDSRLESFGDEYDNFDVVHFGDNHIPWRKQLTDQVDATTFYNPGPLIPRTIDEKRCRPQCGLVYTDNDIVKVKTYYFDSRPDVWLMPDETPKPSISHEAQELIESLSELASLDFSRTLINFLKSRKTNDPVRRLIMEVMNDSERGL